MFARHVRRKSRKVELIVFKSAQRKRNYAIEGCVARLGALQVKSLGSPKKKQALA